MLHLATYIMAPFMGSVMAAPVPSSNTSDISTGAQNPSNSGNFQLINDLQSAVTASDRIALLPLDSDHVYDFLNPPNDDAITTGLGGHTVKADRKDFPALIGNGVSMTVGFIEPCGFNTPHTHPRSAEINIVVSGTLGTEFITENGATVIKNSLSQYQMTVFPQGAIHTEWNPTCEPAVFVAGFASEDPGVQQSAQRFFDLDDDLLEAALGAEVFAGADVEEFRSQIPKNVAMGVESCLQKCGIQKR